MNKICWAKITSKYTGAPYKLGGWSREEGYDSLSVFICMLRDIGLNLPENTGLYGINLTNYTETWQKSKEHAKALIVDFVSTIAKEIPIHEKRTGDILILSLKLGNKRPLSGIMLADKVVAASPTFGVRAFPLSLFKIIKAFRLNEVK